jgi:hypothetical protein
MPQTISNRLVLAGACLAVAASTFLLTDEPGKLTTLSLLIQLLPLLPVDLLAGSGHTQGWYRVVGTSLSLVLNVFVFLSIGGSIHLLLRHRAPRALPLVLTAWLALYLSLLFVLFPVTHFDL